MFIPLTPLQMVSLVAGAANMANQRNKLATEQNKIALETQETLKGIEEQNREALKRIEAQNLEVQRLTVERQRRQSLELERKAIERQRIEEENRALHGKAMERQTSTAQSLEPGRRIAAKKQTSPKGLTHYERDQLHMMKIEEERGLRQKRIMLQEKAKKIESKPKQPFKLKRRQISEGHKLTIYY